MSRPSMSRPFDQWDYSANADDGKLPRAHDESSASRLHHHCRGNSARSGSSDRPSPRRRHDSSKGPTPPPAPPTAIAFAMNLVSTTFCGTGGRWNLDAAAAAAAAAVATGDPAPELGFATTTTVTAREHREVDDDCDALARGILLGAAAVLLRSQDRPTADPLAQPTEAAAVGDEGAAVGDEERAAGDGDDAPRVDGNVPLDVDIGWRNGGGGAICNFCWEVIRDLQLEPLPDYPDDGPVAGAAAVSRSLPNSNKRTKWSAAPPKSARKTSKSNLKLKPPPSSLNRPLITDFNPQVDVSCGRGGFTNNNPANRAFLRRRDELAETYHRAERIGHGKVHVRDELVASVRGRFLRAHPSFVRTWYELSEAEVRAKASQALRDA